MDEKQFIIEASMRIYAANPLMPVKDVVDAAETLWDELSDRDYDGQLTVLDIPAVTRPK